MLCGRDKPKNFAAYERNNNLGQQGAQIFTGYGPSPRNNTVLKLMSENLTKGVVNKLKREDVIIMNNLILVQFKNTNLVYIWWNIEENQPNKYNKHLFTSYYVVPNWSAPKIDVKISVATFNGHKTIFLNFWVFHIFKKVCCFNLTFFKVSRPHAVYPVYLSVNF